MQRGRSLSAASDGDSEHAEKESESQTKAEAETPAVRLVAPVSTTVAERMTVHGRQTRRIEPCPEAPGLAEFEDASDPTCLRVPRRKSGRRCPDRSSRSALPPPTVYIMSFAGRRRGNKVKKGVQFTVMVVGECPGFVSTLRVSSANTHGFPSLRARIPASYALRAY